MDKQDRIVSANISGRVRTGIWTPNEGFRFDQWQKNLVLYTGADVIAKLLAGASLMNIAAMYIEFTNNIGGWSEPSFDRSSDRSYYTGLSGTEDYISAPLAGLPQTAAGSGNYNDNVATFLAMTSGTQGENSVSFGSGSSSVVVGGALVAQPDPDNDSNDVLFSRFYLSSSLAKPAAPAEVVLQWELTVT